MSCPTCGLQTYKDREEMAERHRLNPIYKTDLSKPLSEVVEEIRTRIAAIRGSIGDISRGFPGWQQRAESVDGLLTCGLVALYDMAERMRKLEREAKEEEEAAKKEAERLKQIAEMPNPYHESIYP